MCAHQVVLHEIILKLHKVLYDEIVPDLGNGSLKAGGGEHLCGVFPRRFRVVELAFLGKGGHLQQP